MYLQEHVKKNDATLEITKICLHKFIFFGYFSTLVSNFKMESLNFYFAVLHAG